MCFLTDSLLCQLQCEDVWSKGEAVLYCVGSLKLLSGNSAISSLLLAKDFIGTLLQLSKRLMHGPFTISANLTTQRSEGEGQRIIAGHILVQVGGLWAGVKVILFIVISNPVFNVPIIFAITHIPIYTKTKQKQSKLATHK